MINITVPNNDQLFGENKLDIVNKIGVKSKVTDYAIINGVFAGGYYYDVLHPNLINRVGYYITKYEDNNDFNHIVMINGKGLAQANDYRFTGVRPVINYDNLEELTDEMIYKDGIKHIYYGQYPTSVVCIDKQNELEIRFQEEKLGLSKYLFTQNVSINYDDFIPGYKIVYELDGENYIRCHINKDLIYGKDGVLLSNGNYYPVDSYVWLNVDTLKWYVDDENKKLLSENILFSARGYHEPISYEKNLEDNGIDYFLNNIFIKEINNFEKAKKLIRKY